MANVCLMAVLDVYNEKEKWDKEIAGLLTLENCTRHAKDLIIFVQKILGQKHLEACRKKYKDKGEVLSKFESKYPPKAA